MRTDWDRVYRDETDSVFNYIVYRIGDAARAEDLCSRTFELAWRKRRKFDGSRGTPAAWLIGIARRVIADSRRGRSEDQIDEIEGVADPQSANPEDLAIAQETGSTVREAIRALPLRDKEVIAMKYGAGLTNREISAVTGLTESNVGTIAYRALGKLRGVLEGDFDATG